MRLPQRPPDSDRMISENVIHFLEYPNSKELRAKIKLLEEQYLPWEKLRFHAIDGHDVKFVWALIKMSREQTAKVLPLRGEGQTPLSYNLPDRVQEEIMLIDQELAGRFIRDEPDALAASDTDAYIMSALREEAITSSMLEGAATTRQEAREMLETERKPQNQGERMVLNNYRAIMFIRRQRDAALTPDFLLELQSILTADTLDRVDEVGRFRTVNDNITVVDQRDNEIIHQPPAADELPQRLEALCAFGNGTDGSGFIHPVIRACILHFQMGYDHPFCDGNGRTARALFYWCMLKNRYWLFEYLPISRFIYRAPVKYTEAYLYSERDGFDVTYFLMYHLKIIEQARQELKEHLKQKQQQTSQARQMFENDGRLNHRQREVLLDLAKNPGKKLTIARHKSQFHVAYATARGDLTDMASWGYLEMNQKGKRFEFVAGQRTMDEAGKDSQQSLF